MNTSVELHIQEADTDFSELQALTRELASTLNRQREIIATLPEGTVEQGKKGDLQAIGTVLLQLASSGGVIVSLIGVLKAYFERKPALDVELQRPDGAKLKLHAESLAPNQVDELRAQIAQFLKG